MGDVRPLGGESEVQGVVAADVAVAGNPVPAGARASDTVPSAMSADGDVVFLRADKLGRLIVQPGAAIPELIFKCAQYTTTQTGAALWTPTSGKRAVVVYIQIQAGGTTAGTVQVWFGASGDTTYTRGTDEVIFDGEFAPSSTLKPGFAATNPIGWTGAVDDVVRVTDSAAINPLTVTIWGYEV